MAEVGAEISFRAFQGLRLVKAEPGIQSKIPAGNGSAYLALRTLHPFSLASLAFALAVPKAQPTLTGLLTPDPSLLLIFSPSTEKQSANPVSTTAGVPKPNQRTTVTSPPSPVWSEPSSPITASPVPPAPSPPADPGWAFEGVSHSESFSDLMATS